MPRLLFNSDVNFSKGHFKVFIFPKIFPCERIPCIDVKTFCTCCRKDPTVFGNRLRKCVKSWNKFLFILLVGYFSFGWFRFHELETQARSRERELELQLMELRQRRLQGDATVKEVTLLSGKVTPYTLMWKKVGGNELFKEGSYWLYRTLC